MLQHLDGFDIYSNGDDLALQYTVNNPNLNTTGGRFGGGCYSSVNYTYTLQKSLPTPVAELWTGFAFSLVNTGNSDFLLHDFISASGIECTVTLDGYTGVIKAKRGNNGPVLGSSGSVSMPPGSWHWIEIHLVLNNGAGVLEVWVDGNRVLNVTGANTVGAGGSTIVVCSLADRANSDANNAGYFDDWYILDTTGSHNNTRLGDCRVETLSPTSDASPNDGALTSGSSHFAMVADTHYDGASTTTTLTNTSGQEELFGIGSLVSTPVSIAAVKVTYIAQKSDAGACNLESVISSSSTVATGASTGLTTSYSLLGDIYETDPNTSSPFVYTAVNALKIGVEVP